MELVDVLNKMKQKTGNICKRNELKSGEYRLSAHIWIMNEENKILIQKRNNNYGKYIPYFHDFCFKRLIQ